MFQVGAWTGGFRSWALVAITAAMLMSGTAAADGYDPNPDETLSMTHAWAEDRVDRMEAMLAPEDPPEEEGQAEETSREPQEDPEEESDGESVQAWAAAELTKAEARVQEQTGTLAGIVTQLQYDAEQQVITTQRLVASLGANEESAPEGESTQAAAPSDSGMAKAVMVATVAAAATAGSLFVMFWTAGSTAGTASSAAASSKASSAGLKKVAPVFSPLFTRFEGREVLKHPNRAQLYTLISANPGVRLQDLCVETELSRTAVTHHVRLLEQQHLIVSERVGRSRHYYENGGRYEREKKDAYAVLQNDRSRAIAHYIMGNPGIIQKNLCDSLDLRASIAHWHIKRLQEASLVECVRRGRTVSYYPAGNLSSLSL